MKYLQTSPGSVIFSSYWQNEANAHTYQPSDKSLFLLEAPSVKSTTPSSPLFHQDNTTEKHHFNNSLSLLIKRYNLHKVLASSTAFFQLSLFCAIFLQLCTFIFLISYKTSFSQRVLGLSIGLLDMGFHTYIC